MSVSFGMPSNALHGSLSMDDRDQYNSESNDENLLYMEYINATTNSPTKVQSKDGIDPMSNDDMTTANRSRPVATRNYVSPYLQKLPHSNFLHFKPPTSGNKRKSQRRESRTQTNARPRRSASAVRSRGELLDAAYQPSNLDHLDLSSFCSVSNYSFSRPTSAPIRSQSASTKKKNSSRPNSSKTSTCLVTLYRNGDREKCFHTKANSLNTILQFATEKLRLPAAARRIFDSNGREIYRKEDLQNNNEYYISMGENFKDPFKPIQTQTEYSLNATWTMKGLQMDSNKPKSFTTKTVLSKRLDEQIKTNINLTIFENGFGHDDDSSHILIDSTLKENMEKFLEESTKKLELNSNARKVFNYRGDEIKSLKIFLESDESSMCTAQQTSIVGPLWLSKGERFRPTGAYLFLENRHDEYRSTLNKIRKQYDEVKMVIRRKRERAMIADEDAEASSSDETDDQSKNKKKSVEIKDKSLLSMKRKELKELKKSIGNQMKEIEESIDTYKVKMEEIENDTMNEKQLGAKYAIEHMKEIKFEDKIVGRHPLMLIIHENGSYRDTDPTIHLNLRNLPSKNVGQTSIEYLLDHLQKTLDIFSRQRPKRIFDLNGTEMKLLGQLKTKQHLFVSFGEDYRPAFEPCLAIQLHSAEVFDIADRHVVVKAFRPDDEIIPANDKRSLKQIVANWKPVETVPIDQVQRTNYQTDLDDEQRQAFDAKTINEYLNSNNLFLLKDQKLIYPELKILQKISFDSKSKSTGDKAPPKQLFNPQDLQTWFYNKNGCISNKQFPTLALTVVPKQPIQLTWTPGKFLSERERRTQQLDGYSVQLRIKQNELSDNQIWIFTTDGFIVSKAFQEHALTSLATIFPEDGEKITATGIRMSEDDPTNFFLAVCPQCSPKSPFIHRQRWGIRQESTFTIGDWKYSKVENPLWHRMALTWPVDGTGLMIPDLQWPVEGAFIPGVPPIKSLKSTQAPPAFVPIRLQVLKNGERDQSKAISVVGPDISNLILEPKATVNIYRRLRLPEPEKEQRTDRQLKRNADARQREIKLFLENCTNLCNLPFAARRLFDTNGTELFDLTSIERDSYVYVTCGEQWIDPELTKAEQQRRLLLAQLNNDVRMIYFYCALRNPIEYAIAAEKGLTENSSLALSRCSLNAKQRDRVKQGESIEQVVEHEEPVEIIAKEPEPRTAHERAHKMIDMQEKQRFRHPWETNNTKKSTNADTDDDDVVMGGNDDQTLNESFQQTTDTLSLSRSTRKVPKTKAVAMQRFRWEPVDGYISCMDESHLVLGVREIEGKVVDVFLKRRNPDDIYQRWLFIPANATYHQMECQEQTEVDFTQPFLIVSKARPSMVLTVLLPTCTGNETTEMNISCVGCSITLQQRRDEEFGGAHQKWAYDEQLGFLFAFNTSLEDKEITAANRSNICSYTVTYEAISQPGYVVSILNTSDQAEDVPVCVACAQAMRGKYRLTKINPEQKFTCAIGKRRDLKFHGPFHCLNHKVDLTRNEAENTLFQRQEQLEQLRQEASVRNIVKELAAAKPIQIIHLLAYRNGDGHTKAGQLLIGSSIVGLLDQATQRLSLTNAARRIYVVDGTVILTVEDLMQWITEYYKKRYLQLNKTTLLDKVELNTPLPPKNPDSQRRSSLDNQSEKTTFSTKMRNRSPSKRHFQNLPKFTDLQRAIKQNPMTKTLDVDMSYLLKFPIEVWVSSGEPFVNPSEIDQRQNQRVIQREQRTTVEHDLEREKHILRLMKGRRLFTQAAGELVGQQNSEQPVVKQGHWTETTDEEIFKSDDVKALRSSLEEIRISQQPETTRPISSATTERLSQYSKTKRVLVYLNGESKDTAVQCFGTSLDELKANAKLKFNLMLPIIALFDDNGQLIERFEQLIRDQYVCVSTTKTFVSYSERQHEVDIKANWARTRNKYGDQATDIRVNTVHSSTTTSVDPFGPPVLMMNDQSSQQQIQRRTFSKPPIAPPSAHRRPALPQSVPSSTLIQEITTPTTMMKDSLQMNDDDDDDDDDETDSEIERITNLDHEDQHDGFTPKTNQDKREALSPLLKSESASPTLPTMNKSDSDQDEDDFIRMLKGK